MGSRLGIFLLMLFLFVSEASFSAVSKAPTLGEIQALKKEVATKTKELESLKKTMNSLEKELGERNQKLVRLFDVKRELEVQMSRFSTDLVHKKDQVDEQVKQVQKILKSAILSSMSGSIDPASLLAKKYLLEGLRKKNNLLTSSVEELETVESNLLALQARFAEYSKVEGQLSELLSQLEADKNSKASEYLAALDSKKEKEGMLSQYQASFLSSRKGAEIRKKVGMLFKSPVASYSSISYKDKGVTFLNPSSSSIDVMATGDGKVVYSGDLSNYGNVVMIDHGNETRSILLGRFNPLVKKGDSVTSGERVAKTLKSKDQAPGKLYFEVRIKNQIQNTVLLLDELATMQNIASSQKL